MATHFPSPPNRDQITRDTRYLSSERMAWCGMAFPNPHEKKNQSLQNPAAIARTVRLPNWTNLDLLQGFGQSRLYQLSTLGLT